jgi:hypothetical protein
MNTTTQRQTDRQASPARLPHLAEMLAATRRYFAAPVSAGAGVAPPVDRSRDLIVDPMVDRTACPG